MFQIQSLKSEIYIFYCFILYQRYRIYSAEDVSLWVVLSINKFTWLQWIDTWKDKMIAYFLFYLKPNSNIK